MSRTATAGELAVLARKERATGHRIKVQNGSGTMIDYSNWLDSGKISRDVDQPIDGCTLNFVRSKSNQSVIQSLSPLRTDSVINRLDNGVTYSPALDLNRIVTVEIPTTAIGSPILETDYKLLFKGTIDVVSFEQNPVVAVCRDLGAPLVDRWIETETTFGTGVAGSGVGGRAIQLVMQDILDAVFGPGVYALYTPVSPSSDLNTYKQQRMSVMDALQDLAQQIGWDVRYRWDDGTSAFRLTLSEPPRSKTTPDYTFGPSAYHDITELSLDITDIRNVITGTYRNANNLGNRDTITVTDATSISKYGRRFMLIQEADISPIDSSSEMTTMVNSALADLKEPKASQSVNMPLHWTADLWDLYRYSPNSVHYDSNQDIAVVELTHEFAPNYHRTTAVVRGTPIGQYATWLGRSGPIPPGGGVGIGAKPPYPFIQPLNTEGDELDWDFRFNSVLGSGGGGTNLTYTVKLKKTFATETTLSSGNASAFPLDLTVLRDPKQNAVLTFRVTDAATAMFAEATYPIPAYSPSVNATGNVIRSHPYSDGAYAVKAEDTAGQTISTGGKGKSDFAVKNSGGTTSFGTNRHNDEQSGKDAGSTKSFGVTFDNIPQMRALPQNIMTYRQASAAADQNIDVRATNVTVSTYDTRAKIVTGGTSTPQTDDFAATLNGTPVAAGVLIENDGAAAYCNLADANAVLTTYIAFFDVDTLDMDALNTLYVDLYKNDGVSSTSWTLVGSKSYGPGQDFSDIIQFSAALADDWDTRIVVSYETTPQALEKAHVTCQEMTYNVITGGSEFDATALGAAAVIFQAMEAP